MKILSQRNNLERRHQDNESIYFFFWKAINHFNGYLFIYVFKSVGSTLESLHDLEAVVGSWATKLCKIRM